MKVRKMAKNVYNFIKKETCVTPSYLTYKFGSGNTEIGSPMIAKTVTGVGISDQLSDAVCTLLNEANILEIACGQKLYFMLGGCKIGDLPLARYQSKHNGSEYQKYGYTGYRWMPVVYCSDKGAINLLRMLMISSGTGDKLPSNYNENLTTYNGLLKGSKYDRFKAMSVLSQTLTEHYPKEWDYALSKVKLVPEAKFKTEYLNNMPEREQKEVKRMITGEKFNLIVAKGPTPKLPNFEEAYKGLGRVKN